MGLFKEQMYRISEISKSQQEIEIDVEEIIHDRDYVMGIPIRDFSDPLLSELKDLIDFFPDDMKKRKEHRSGDSVKVDWTLTVEWDNDNIQSITISYIALHGVKFIQIKSKKELT